MFSDLKGLSTYEENFKVELLDSRNKRQELEGLMEDLKEKCHNQEMKIRN